MYQKSATLYDAIYASKGKNYAGEAHKLHQLIQQCKRSTGNDLLDVACGTGLHLAHFKEHYRVEGLDINPEMLEIARQRCPDIPFHQGDMMTFNLQREFDAITCLFSSIGYVKTIEHLNRTITNFARHLKPGGVLIIEPWFTPEQYKPGGVYATFVDEANLKLARINIGEQQGRLAIMNMHHLVGAPQAVQHFVERHEMGLFTNEEYLGACRATGLAVKHDSAGLIGRGLYIGVK